MSGLFFFPTKFCEGAFVVLSNLHTRYENAFRIQPTMVWYCLHYKCTATKNSQKTKCGVKHFCEY